MITIKSHVNTVLGLSTHYRALKYIVRALHKDPSAECTRTPGLEHSSDRKPDRRRAVMRLLAIVFSATLFAVVLAHEASALRGGGIRAGGVGLRGVSVGGYRGALRARNVGYRAAALGGRRYWRGGRWYGYGAGLGALRSEERRVGKEWRAEWAPRDAEKSD